MEKPQPEIIPPADSPHVSIGEARELVKTVPAAVDRLCTVGDDVSKDFRNYALGTGAIAAGLAGYAIFSHGSPKAFRWVAGGGAAITGAATAMLGMTCQTAKMIGPSLKQESAAFMHALKTQASVAEGLAQYFTGTLRRHEVADRGAAETAIVERAWEFGMQKGYLKPGADHEHLEVGVGKPGGDVRVAELREMTDGKAL